MKPTRPARERVAKVCTKCEVSYTMEEFDALQYVGAQDAFDKQGRCELELRNCPCGSTIAIEVLK